MKITCVFFCVLMLPVPSIAADIALGSVGTLDISAYKAKRENDSLLPVVSFDNDIVYIDGDEAGYYLVNDDVNELKLKTFYFDSSYRAKDGRNIGMRRLDNRYSTMMSGISYQRTTPIGAFHTQLVADTLNKSQGIIPSASYINLITFNALSIVPKLGVDWANGQQTRYYYGISQQEAQRSGMVAYRPHASFTPYASVVIDYRFVSHWEGYISARRDFLSSTVRNSPMVDRNNTYAFALGVNYNFGV